MVNTKKASIITKLKALKNIYLLSSKEIDTFIDSFKLFDKEDGFSDKTDWEAGKQHATFIMNSEDTQKVVDYYGVINMLCALGNVEKMYIPPVLNIKKSVFENQILFEEKLADTLKINKDSIALELGCGVGRIAEHISDYTGSTVHGINIDPVQIKLAKKYHDKSQNLHFHIADFNEPLPFPDEMFDAVYSIQPLTYTHNLNVLFTEILRVLKPKGRCCYLEAVMKGNFDGRDEKHLKLLRACRQVTGMGGFWFQNSEGGFFTTAMESSGFEILENYEMSNGGNQGPLIKKEMQNFKGMERVARLLSKVPFLIPKHIFILFDRLNYGIDSFIEMDKLEMYTTSWFISAVK
jgi:sterol 24-C-methyltransferase